MAEKMCPLKFNRPHIDDCRCEEEECAWWNEYLERCAMTVDAELKAWEKRRQELTWQAP